MKALLATAILVALVTPTMAEDGLETTAKWEKASRNSVPHPRKKVPAAQALVVRANSLLRGDPTCDQMLQASRLLEKADDLYIDASTFDGDVRTIGRRVAWLEELAKAGRCSKVASGPLPRPRPEIE
jgi:hypothetical protein